MASVTMCGIAATNLTSKFSMGRSKAALKGASPPRSRRFHHPRKPVELAPSELDWQDGAPPSRPLERLD